MTAHVHTMQPDVTTVHTHDHDPARHPRAYQAAHEQEHAMTRTNTTTVDVARLARQIGAGTRTADQVQADLAAAGETELAGTVGLAAFRAEQRYPMPSRLEAGWFTRQKVEQDRAKAVQADLERAGL